MQNFSVLRNRSISSTAKCEGKKKKAVICAKRWIYYLYCLCYLQGDADVFTNHCTPREGFQGFVSAQNKPDAQLGARQRMKSEWDAQQHSTAHPQQ